MSKCCLKRLGAAFAAGLETGMWSGKKGIRKIWKAEKVFNRQMDEKEAEALCKGWEKAVGRSLKWLEH